MENTILLGDCKTTLSQFSDKTVDTCITSPPYFGLRDYGMANQIGAEETPEAFIENLVLVFREVKRILKDNGTLWVNIGDSYAANRASQVPQSKHKSMDYGTSNATKVPLGLKQKDLMGIPWMLAFALRADGWYLRQDIIWSKPNVMPESVTDRCTKSHEYIFLLSKNKNYYFDYEAIKEKANTQPQYRDKKGEGYQADYPSGDRFSEGGRVYGSDGKRNKRSVWEVNTKPYSEAHFATFPEKLIEPCILAGSKVGGVVLDPFMGAGTTALVALRANRKFLGCELNKDYINIANKRLKSLLTQMDLFK